MITPLPVQAACAALWADEAHVEASRALYRDKFAMAETILEVRAPEGGFFLWLDASALGGGEQAGLRLWHEAGAKVIPGAYLAVETGGAIPGEARIRIALVGDAKTTHDALLRIARILDP